MSLNIEKAVGFAVGAGLVASGCRPPDAVPVGSVSSEKISPSAVLTETESEEKVKREKIELPLIIQTPAPGSEVAPYFLTKEQIELAMKRRENAGKVIDENIQPYNRDGAVFLGNLGNRYQTGTEGYYRQWLETNDVLVTVVGNRSESGSNTQSIQDVALRVDYSSEGNITRAALNSNLRSKDEVGDLFDEGGKIKPGISNEEFFSTVKQALGSFYVLPEDIQWREYSDQTSSDITMLAVIGRGRFDDGRSVLLYASVYGSLDEGAIVVSYPGSEEEKVKKEAESPQ